MSEILRTADIRPKKRRSRLERSIAASQIELPRGSRKKRKRKGRGHSSGMGKTASRGENGQKSRSGYSYMAGFEGGQMPLHRRLPKRGFRSVNPVSYQLVNLSRLQKAGLTGEVGPEELQAKGLIRSSRRLIKVLGDGDLQASLQITADAFSASAKKKIEAAGGTCSERDLKAERKAKKKAEKEARKTEA